MKNIQKEEFKDLGFSSRVSAQRNRLLNQDGSFNLERRGLPKFRTEDLYHNLITMRWPKFLLLIVIAYTIVNIV